MAPALFTAWKKIAEGVLKKFKFDFDRPDAIHDAVVHLWTNLHRMKLDGNTFSYSTTIVINFFKQRWRTEKNEISKRVKFWDSLTEKEKRERSN